MLRFGLLDWTGSANLVHCRPATGEWPSCIETCRATATVQAQTLALRGYAVPRHQLSARSLAEGSSAVPLPLATQAC